MVHPSLQLLDFFDFFYLFDVLEVFGVHFVVAFADVREVLLVAGVSVDAEGVLACGV